MQLFLFILLLATAAAAIGLWWLAHRLQAQSGLPARSRVVYSDTGAWKKVEKPLFSRRHLLTGKPDYVVESDGVYVPVEVKPSRIASEPRDADVLQLAAYCLLVGEQFGMRPDHGLLKYRDRVFRVEFSDSIEAELLGVLEEMRSGLEAADVSRSHQDPRRCVTCGYRQVCGQALENPKSQ